MLILCAKNQEYACCFNQNFSAILVYKEPFDNMIRGLIRGLFIREVIYWIVILYVQGGLPDWMTESVILIIVRLLDTIVRGLWNSVYNYRHYYLF